MKPYYAEAIAGTLKSKPMGSTTLEVKIQNFLKVHVIFFYVSDTGLLLDVPSNKIVPSGTGIFRAPFVTGSYLVVKSLSTGGFIGVFALDTAIKEYYIMPAMLSNPQDIGQIPEPTTECIVPKDSQPVVVGYGVWGNRSFIREQSWQKMADSYTLAPRETRTVGSTFTSGMTQTSSTEESVSKALSIDTSLGWGPISSNISMSLNTTSTSMQSYTINQEETSYESSEVTNTNDFPVMNVRWQLCDTVTIFDLVKSAEAAASVISRVPPSIVKSYNLQKLVKAEEPPALSTETLKWWMSQQKEK
ncbi:hypothetical protein [Chitinophaga flava]|uniref:Uncharacterized protein n=1 Tax=Chitinophaga flava TaxID=2259036 RepID=A0A365XU93_9BACT|nr:hypothetical protein [Chitinophaga flava]RBL89903.1 hypothetical protein DF182_25845 [Chitinophaga flava]